MNFKSDIIEDCKDNNKEIINRNNQTFEMFRNSEVKVNIFC